LTDPRGIGEPPPPLTPELIAARRAQLAEDIAAWMPRLVGRFKVYGIVDYNPETSNDGGGASMHGGGGRMYGGGASMDGGGASMDGGDTAAATAESGNSYAYVDPGNPIDPLKIKEASGKADCVAIGTGPGVHCLFHVTWPAEWIPPVMGLLPSVMGKPRDGGDPFLAPAMKLFGFDPNDMVVRQLQLDTNGVAELQSAKLKNHTLSWIYPTRCESNTWPEVLCRRISRIYSRPGSKVIQWAIDYEKWDPDLPEPWASRWTLVTSFVLDMRREAEERVTGASSLPAAPGLP
jgi:hypothetical protein